MIETPKYNTPMEYAITQETMILALWKPVVDESDTEIDTEK